MNKKVTRRVALGSLVGGAILLPFTRKIFKEKSGGMPLGSDSYLAKFRSKYREALSFPRDYESSLQKNKVLKDDPRFFNQPSEVVDKVLAVHKRYWSNYAQIDEAEFDYASHRYDKNGQRDDGNFQFEGHVKMKYGYGMEVKGVDRLGKDIHWVFNMDGNASLPAAKKMNLSSLMFSFFQATMARPDWLLPSNVFAQNVPMPSNLEEMGFQAGVNVFPEGTNILSQKTGRYDVLAVLPRGKYPREDEVFFRHTYYDRDNGVPVLIARQSIQGVNLKDLADSSMPLPPLEASVEQLQHEAIAGIHVLADYRSYFNGMLRREKQHRNIKIKLFS